MGWRKAFLAGSAALGAAATFNVLVGRSTKSLENLLGGEESWFTWRGRRIAYTRHDESPKPSRYPLLLVHGIHAGASSFEWRSNVDPFSETHTTYALDLLGFGRSDRPDIRYSGRLYLNLISDFARQVVGRPCILVATSLSAAYAAVLGARDPSRFPALVLTEPTGLTRLTDQAGAGGDIARLVIDSPVLGSALFNGLVSRPSLRYYLERVYANHDLVTEELLDHYHRSSHQPGSRFAPAAFLAEQLNIDIRSAMRRLGQPVLVTWGEQALELPVEDAFRFRTLKRDLELLIIDGAGSLPHHEKAAEWNRAVLEFLTRVEAEIPSES